MPIKLNLAIRASGEIFSKVVGAVTRELKIFDEIFMAVSATFGAICGVLLSYHVSINRKSSDIQRWRAV
jgi:MoxR-like ATPase